MEGGVRFMLPQHELLHLQRKLLCPNVSKSHPMPSQGHPSKTILLFLTIRGSGVNLRGKTKLVRA